MPIAKVQLPDGRIARFEVPDGTTPEQVEEFARGMNFDQQGPQEPPQAKEKQGVGSYLVETVMNVPGSSYEFAKNIATAVAHPVETGKGLGTLTGGVLAKTGKEITERTGYKPQGLDDEGINKLVQAGTLSEADAETLRRNVAEAPQREATSEAVTQFFADRYGGQEQLLNTIKEDPVGFLADLSLVLSAGGSTVAKVPGLARVGGAVAKVGRAIEPISVASKAASPIAKAGAKVVGKVAPEVLGTVAGGPESIRQAFKGEASGLTGAKSPYLEGIRGKVTGEDVLTEAKGALGAVKEDRSATYRQRLAEIGKDKTKISLVPVKDKLAELMKRYNIKDLGKDGLDFSRSTLNRNARGDIEDIIVTVKSWGTREGDGTAIGLDTLKRQLDDFYTESKNSKAFVTELRNNVKSQIVSSIPEYAKMTKDYEKITRITNEMERALSLGSKPMADTAIKKLLSTMRENFEFRKSLVNKLQEMSGNKDILGHAAGVSMSQVVPTGLVGKLAVGGGAIATHLDPTFLAVAALASPRVMGEFLNTLGFTKNQIVEFMSAIKKSKIASAPARQVAFQAGRAQNVTEEQQP